jgi:D-threo-aldose 1-dehydrogenase
VAERFVGLALETRPRSSYTLATKVCLEFEGSDARRFYSRDEVMRGLEGSFQRLKLDRVDILHIHDPAEDGFALIVDETFPLLQELKAQGVTRAISLGTGEYQLARRLARALPFDAIMLAGRYTLLEQPALETIAEMSERGMSVFSAGLYNSGILATGTRTGTPIYNYSSAPPEIVARVQRLEAVCDRHGVRLKAAAAQFVKANLGITSIVLGAESVAQIEENVRVFHEPIPAAFWADLRAEGLVDARAPLPEN